MMLDIFGIFCSLVLIASFSVKGEKNIRIVNFIGGLLFVIYGIMVGAVGTWLSNGVICIIHIVRFIGMKRKHE